MKKEIRNFCEEIGISENQFYGNEKYSGYLYLRSLTSIPEGFNPTVGGSLDLSSLLKNKVKINEYNNDLLFMWQSGKYLKIDGIFVEVLNKRGNVYKVKKVNKSKEFYIVSDGVKYSHGDTIKEAKEDLLYKISNRSKDEYNNLNLESELSFEKAIECYRVITGACSFGAKDFVLNRLKNRQKKYTIKEIIDATKGEYQSETFRNFFNK